MNAINECNKTSPNMKQQKPKINKTGYLHHDTSSLMGVRESTQGHGDDQVSFLSQPLRLPEI